jgi:hypothetical protein
VDGVYGTGMHAKRIAFLAGATLGVMQSASLAVAMIGQALALAKGLITKHAIKQVDWMLSNSSIDVRGSFACWVPHQIVEQREVLVAMEWTDFDNDDQATLALLLVNGHGRAAPLLWRSVWKDELKDHRNDFEDACLRRLAQLLPAGCRVTILAERCFPCACFPNLSAEVETAPYCVADAIARRDHECQRSSPPAPRPHSSRTRAQSACVR